MPNHFVTMAAMAGLLVLPAATPCARQADRTPELNGVLTDTLRARDIIGKPAYDAEGRDLGTVDDLLIGTNGRVFAAIVGVGGLMAINRHMVAVPWSKIKVDPTDHHVVISLTKDQLKSAPEYRDSGQATILSDPQRPGKQKK